MHELLYSALSNQITSLLPNTVVLRSP